MVSNLKKLEIEKYINTEYKKMDNRGKKHKMEKHVVLLTTEYAFAMIGIFILLLSVSVCSVFPRLIGLIIGLVLLLDGTRKTLDTHELLKQEIKNL